MDVFNLISSSSSFSKSSLYIWKFSVHILLKPSLKDFEHYLVSMWNEHNKYVCVCVCVYMYMGFPEGSVVNTLPANARETRDGGLIPGSGRSPGLANGNQLQNSLENSMDREAWWATIQVVAKESDTTDYAQTYKCIHYEFCEMCSYLSI